MADRYWVGGTETWSTTNTSSWSATSGGSGGASIPTLDDNVYFDGSSDVGTSFTVTMGSGSICKNLIIGDGSTVTTLDQTMSLSGSNAVTIHGSLFFPATRLVTSNFSGAWTFAATTTGNTITTNGVTLQTGNDRTVTFTNGGEWTLGSSLTVTSVQGNSLISLVQGTLNTANYNLTCDRFFSFGTTNTRVLNLGSSTILVRYSSSGTSPTNPTVYAPWCVGNANTNLTINAGTSTIFFGESSVSRDFFGGDGHTYYRVQVFNTANNIKFLVGSSTYYEIVGRAGLDLINSPTVTNLVWLPRSSAGVDTLTLRNNIIVTGSYYFQSGYGATFNTTASSGIITEVTIASGGLAYSVNDILSIPGGDNQALLRVASIATQGAISTVTIASGGAAYTSTTNVTASLVTQSLSRGNRLLVNSNIFGTPRIISASAISLYNVDFRDITAAGPSAPWNLSALSVGDCLGNTNITFPAPKTVYWNLAGTQNWSATAWATSSGGTPAVENFPLAQDTVIFNNSGSAGTITTQNFNVGNLDMSARSTSSMTLSISAGTMPCYGSISIPSGIWAGGANSTLALLGRGTHTFGIGPINSNINITSVAGTYSTSRVMSLGGGNLNFSLSSGSLIFNHPFTWTSTGGAFTISPGTSVVLNADVTSSGISPALNVSNLQLNSYTWRASGLNPTIPSNANWNFGTGKFELSGGMNFSGTGGTATFAGSKLFEFFNTTPTTFVIQQTGGLSEQNAINLLFREGQSTGSVLQFQANVENRVGNLTILSGRLGTGNISGRTLTTYGDVVFGPDTVSNHGQTDNPLIFAKSSGTQTLTMNGKTLLCNVQKSENGALQLIDNLILSSSRTFTLTQGTLNLNNKNLSVGSFVSNNSNTRQINFGNNGTLELTQSGSAFNATTGTNQITSGVGEIIMTSNFAKTFVGGGRSYPTLVQSGSGALTITGNNTFRRLRNATRPTTINITGGSAQTIKYMNLAGTPTDKVILNSTTTSNYTLSSSYNLPQVVNSIIVSRSVAFPSGSWYGDIYSSGSSTTNWIFLTASRPSMRLIKGNTFYTDRGSQMEIDEVSSNTIRMTSGAMYATEFDEVTPVNVLLRLGNDGTVYVSSSIDEVGILF